MFFPSFFPLAPEYPHSSSYSPRPCAFFRGFASRVSYQSSPGLRLRLPKSYCQPRTLCNQPRGSHTQADMRTQATACTVAPIEEEGKKRGRYKRTHILTQRFMNGKQKCSSGQSQFCSSHQRKSVFFFMGVIKKPPFISCQTELGQQIETHQSHSTWRSDTGKLSPSASLQRLFLGNRPLHVREDFVCKCLYPFRRF